MRTHTKAAIFLDENVFFSGDQFFYTMESFDMLSSLEMREFTNEMQVLPTKWRRDR